MPRLILRKRKGSPLLVIKGKNGERKKAFLLKEENPGLWSPNKSSSFSLEHKGFLCLLLAPRERRVVTKRNGRKQCYVLPREIEQLGCMRSFSIGRSRRPGEAAAK